MEERKQQMLRRLADRHEKRVLQSQNAPRVSSKIDLSATEKAFFSTDASELDLKTPVKTRIATVDSFSPLLSFDEKADRQMLALSTWCNTMMDLEECGEMDLGSSKIEACRRIKAMLGKKNIESEVPRVEKSRYSSIFEKNDSLKIRQKCRTLLIDSEIEEGITTVLSKNILSVKSEISIFSDLALQTSLLRMFLSFHPAWLKAALEAVFNTCIETSPSHTSSILSRFIMSRVFTNEKYLKNKKFAQGSGKPIITPAGKEALHRHFLLCTMKIMFVIENGHSQQIIPNVSRIFTKSSPFKNLNDMFSEISKEILSGSSMPMKKAFAKIGFTPTYQQSFFDDYSYTAKGFSDFSNGLVFAKLTEAVGGMKHGTILCRLRDPSGDRIRKLKNAELVLAEMEKLGIATEGVTAADIVACKKEAILSLLWAIIGVRVAEGMKLKPVRQLFDEDSENRPSDRNRVAVNNDMDMAVLQMCRNYGRDLNVYVPNLESLTNGELLAKMWNMYNSKTYPAQFYSGDTMWEKVVDLAEREMGIRRGIDQHIPLFVKMFVERLQQIVFLNHKATIIQRAWKSYKYRKMELETTYRCSISSQSDVCQRTFVIQRAIEEEDEDKTIVIDEEETTTNEVSQNAKPDADCFVSNSTDVRESEPDVACVEALTTECESSNEVSVESTGFEDVEPVLEETENVVEVVTEMETTQSTIVETEEVLAEAPLEEGETQCELETVPIAETVEEAQVVESHFDNEQDEIKNVSEIEVEKEMENFSEARPSIDTDALEQQKQKIKEDAERFIEISRARTLKILELASQKPVQKNLETENKENEDVQEKEQDEQLVSTPELREILRAKRRICIEQKKINDKLNRFERKLGGVAMNFVDIDMNNALIESVSSESQIVKSENGSIVDQHERTIAGHEENDITQSTFAASDKVESKDDATQTSEKDDSSIAILIKAAITIQRFARGYRVRRSMKLQITERQQRVQEYNEVMSNVDIAYANAVTDGQQIDDTRSHTVVAMVPTSAEMKLRIHTVHGLSDGNLNIVLLSATIIDRLLALAPTLIDSFVNLYGGIGQINDIFEVADRGYAYTRILEPLARILRKVVEQKDLTRSSEVIRSMLPKLSPRLMHLMLAHCTNELLFEDICAVLARIARVWPIDCHMNKIGFFVDKSKARVRNNLKCSKALEKLESACMHLKK